MRLYKYIKTYANLTTKKTKELYEANEIKVNNEIKPLSWLISDDDIVTIHNETINRRPFIYYLYYKPRGIRSDITSAPNSYIKNINLPDKVMPCGRLDKESEGLMILTNDGKFINKVANHQNGYTKEYIVKLKNKITKEFLQSIIEPFSIKNKNTLPISCIMVDDFSLILTLQDGRYHQIRRAVIRSGNTVVTLKRTRIGPYELGDIKPGELKQININ